MNKNREIAKRLHESKYKLVNGERGSFYWLCIYCGQPADTRDHVPPITRVDDYQSIGLKKELYIKAPSCGQCNRIAGDVLDETFMDRIERVKDKIARKYAKCIGCDWDDDDLKDIGPNLKTKILENSKKAKLHTSRIEYYVGVDLILDDIRECDAKT